MRARTAVFRPWFDNLEILKHGLVVGCWVLLLSSVGLPKDNSETYVHHIDRYEAAVTIDGVPDEAVWERIQPITAFTQTEPDEDQPSEERTEVRAFYDDEYLYLSIRCFEEHASASTRRIDPRDSINGSDRVALLLDPFYDRRNAYLFAVTPRGVQQDGLISESSGRGGRNSNLDIDLNWDAVWSSAARINGEYWDVEIRIPFHIMRIPSDGGRQWGFNVERIVTHRDERSYWVPVRRVDNRFRPSQAGTLTGIQGIEQKDVTVEYIPYVSTQVRSFETYKGPKFDFTPNGGLDVKASIGSTLTADITLNPDFGATEVDEENISLSRFELFFPEKRQFFTEGADIFRTPINIFFTRRIGQVLSDGTPQRLLAGARLTGRLGKNRIGIMESVTGERRFSDPETGQELVAPGANFFVFRLQRDLFSRSSIGFTTANRDQTTDGLFDPARVHSVDLNLIKGDTITWVSQFALSQNPDEPDDLDNPDVLSDHFSTLDRRAIISEFRYSSINYLFELKYRDIGQGFDVSNIGFLPEVDRIGGEWRFRFRPRIRRFGIREMRVGASGLHFANHHKQTERAQISPSFFLDFDNFWTLGVFYDFNRERFFAFDGGERLDPTVIYKPNQFFIFLRTNRNRPVFFNLRYSQGRFIDFEDNFFGRSRRLGVDVNARLGDHLRMSLDSEFNREFRQDRTFDEDRNLYRLRVSYLFSAKLRFRTLIQYNTQRRQTSSQSQLFYEFTPRSSFAAVYNDTHTTTRGQFVPLDRSFFVRFSYLF